MVPKCLIRHYGMAMAGVVPGNETCEGINCVCCVKKRPLFIPTY